MALPANATLKSKPKENKPDLMKSPMADMFGIKNGKQVEEINIDLLDAHPEQHHYSMNEDELNDLAESIKDVGVIDPIHIQLKGDGRYTILAGHRRTEASRRAGNTTIPALVADVDDATATIYFNATNLFSREKLLPSERLYGYVEIEKAIAAKGGATPCRTTGDIAEMTGDNKRTIQRYMRLKNLVPGLMEMVDSGAVTFRAAVDLSYLSSITQEVLLSIVAEHGIEKISMEQAETLKQTADNGEVKKDEIEVILGLKKETQPKKPPVKAVKIKMDEINHLLPEGCTDKDAASYIKKALEAYKGKDDAE